MVARAGTGPEYATFFVKGNLFAVAAGAVQEALPASSVAPVSIGTSHECIGVIRACVGPSAAPGQPGTGAPPGFVWAFDLGAFLSGERSTVVPGSQVVVVRHGERALGLLADTLHGVACVNPEQIIDMPMTGDDDRQLVKQLIKQQGGDLLIQVINLPYLFDLLTEPAEQVQVQAQSQARSQMHAQPQSQPHPQAQLQQPSQSQATC